MLRTTQVVTGAWGVAVALVPWLLQAQDAARTSGGLALEEIVIVGEKIDRSLQDTATSVGVVTAELLEDQQITRLFDAISLVGNVTPPSRSNEGFSIRGVNSEGITGPAGGLPVSTIYVDGAPQSFQGARRGAMGAWDVAQVEVFRGPQSTNQGRNALAGAIYVTTNDPTFEWEAGGRVLYGEDDTQQWSGVLSGPIAGESVAFRVAADWSEQGRSVDVRNQAVEPFEGENWGVRAKLLLTPASMPGLSVNLGFFKGFDHPASRAVTGPDYFEEVFDGAASLNAIELEEVDITTWILDASYDITDRVVFSALTSYQTTDFLERGEGDLDLTTTDDATELTQELRVTYQSDRTEAVVGLFFADADNENTFLAEGLFTIAPGYAPFVRQEIAGDSTRETFAVFGELSYDIAEAWTITVGGRYDREEFDDRTSFQLQVDPDFFGLSTPLSVTPSATTFDAFLPRAVLTWRAAEDLSLSASAARGYRGGGVSVAAIVGERAYGPEYTWNYELALRSQWLDRRLTANANVFYTDWQDQQVTQSPIGNSQVQFIENAGESTLYGGELDISVLAARGVTIFASIGYVNAEFDEFESVDLGDLSGNRFVRSPRATGAVGINWKSVSGLIANAAVRYTGDRYQDAANEILLEDYTLVNAKLGYEGDRWSVYVFGENLLDEEYIAFRSDAENFAELGGARFVGLGLEFSF